MKKQHFLSVLILSALILPMKAQEMILKKDEKEYNGKDDINVAGVYLEVAKSGYESNELYKKLGDTYYFDTNYEEATIWYSKLYESTDGMIEPDYLWRYSQSLRAMGKKNMADQIYDKFLNICGVINVEFPTSLDNLDRDGKNSYRPIVKFSPIIPKSPYHGSLVKNDFQDFPSSERDLASPKRTVSQDSRSYEGTTIPTLHTTIKVHESNVTIARDGRTMYFTRAAHMPNLTEGNKERLRIYRANLVYDKWTDVEDLSINGDNYSNANPVLGPNEKTLYFTSDMPTSYGKTDIYAVAINDDGSLGKPWNLGAGINTKGNELFPSVTPDNGLYFSSDGHYGSGGLDIFYHDLKDQDVKLLNLGSPINGPTDDFTLLNKNFNAIRPRDGNHHSADKSMPVKGFLRMKITGTVRDRKTGKPIKDALVTFTNKNGEVATAMRTNEEGLYSVGLDRFKSYVIKAEKKDYFTMDKFHAKGSNSRYLDLKLTRNTFKVTDENRQGKNLDLARVLNIDWRSFKDDRSYIKGEAMAELAKIAVVMDQFPEMRIKIRSSHADCADENDCDIWPSKGGAGFILKFMTDKGIDASRLSLAPFGEKKSLMPLECSKPEFYEEGKLEFMARL